MIHPISAQRRHLALGRAPCTEDYVEDGRAHILQNKDIPYYATIFRIHGPFLFGATDKIQVVTENIHKLPPS